MATVNQRIPNFLGGVSQQPDKIKFPGQLRVCNNAVPDITFGLEKRPPAELVKVLTNANTTGQWFNIIRDGDEKYIFQISPSSVLASGQKPIRIWNLETGVEQTLTNPANDALFAYLTVGGNSYTTTTIQDYTLISNITKNVERSSDTTFTAINNGEYGYARLDTVAYNTEYVLYLSGASFATPTPKTYYRVTSVKVDKLTNNTPEGPTWNDSNENQSFAGTLTWSFSGGDQIVTGTSQNTNCEDIEGSLQINGSSYIASNTATYQGASTSGTPTTSGTGDEFLGYTQDYDVRYTATVTLTDGGLIRETNKTTALNKFIDVNIENIHYRISVEAVEPVTTYRDVTGIAYFKTPKNPDNGPLSMQTILTGLKDAVNSSVSQVTAEIIGSGLFLTGSNAASVNFLGGAVNENMSVIGQKVQDISRLPAMCKHGYVAQVSNTGELETDDYYVKFEATNGDSGVGSWEECVRPHNFATNINTVYNWSQSNFVVTVTQLSGSHNFEVGDEVFLAFSGGAGSAPPGPAFYTVAGVNANSTNFTFLAPQSNNISGVNLTCTVSSDHMHAGFDPATMPHALINNRNGTFTFNKLDIATGQIYGNENYWKDREVGDNTSNPFPTILGSPIQKMFFHRNRLGLISGEQIVMSQPGQYFNLFIVSAIAASDDNPIDITVSDVKPAFINHILPIQKGVMMFSDNAQFLLFTESDIFSPKTVRLKKVSSYECDASIQPVDLGTSVLFTSNVSGFARAFEITIIDDDAPPNIIEQTRVVPEFLPKTIDIAANSTSIGIVSYADKGAQALDQNVSSNIYHYKYYNAGNQREQSAWYTWTVRGILNHMLYTSGNFYTVTYFNNQFMLSRHEYVSNSSSNNSYLLGTGSLPVNVSRRLEPCLDFSCIPTAITVTNDDTRLTLPFEAGITGGLLASDIKVVCLSGNDTDGNSLDGSVFFASAVVVGLSQIVVPNIKIDSSAKLIVGYKYDTTIELPTYYLNTGQNAYDLEGDLRVSGINFELGISGPMEFHLTSPFSYTDANGNVTKDIDDYIQYETGMITGLSNFNTIPAKLSKTVRVPVQRKNDKYNLKIKVTDPFPIALISASWDGIYNQKRHVRR